MSNEVKYESRKDPATMGMGHDGAMVELDRNRIGGTPCLSDGSLPEYESPALFQGRREILIRHGEAVYRLKITRQGKLILNK
jgi:hemin uptake protein HemP